MVVGFGQADGPPGYLLQFYCSLCIGDFLGKLVNRGRRIGGNETVSMVYGEVGVLVACSLCQNLLHSGFLDSRLLFKFYRYLVRLWVRKRELSRRVGLELVYYPSTPYIF